MNLDSNDDEIMRLQHFIMIDFGFPGHNFFWFVLISLHFRYKALLNPVLQTVTFNKQRPKQPDVSLMAQPNH